MTYEEIDATIRKIASGKEILFISDKFIYIVHPNNEIKIKAAIIREAAYEEAKKEGLLPRKKLEELIYERGIFSQKDEEAVSKLQSKIEAQEILLAKTLKVRANQDRIKKTISELQNELDQLLFKKQSKLYMSADNKADEEMYNFMCSECVYLDSNIKYWSSYQEFIEDKNFEKKDKIFSTFMKLLRGVDTSIVRYIARSNLWRIRYISSLKTSEVLFNVPIVEYTSDQLNLIHWSNYYEQVYSMLSSDRPSDTIIEDDIMLDKYMEEYYKELSNEAAISRNNKNKDRFSTGLSALDAEEVIITRASELYQEIEYDKPREAQKIKDKNNIKKKAIADKQAYLRNKTPGG